jgi:hypothetical protein
MNRRVGDCPAADLWVEPLGPTFRVSFEGLSSPEASGAKAQSARAINVGAALPVSG